MFTRDVLNDSVDQFNAVRLDKPCGNSHIPDRDKCSKGAGKAKRKRGGKRLKKAGKVAAELGILAGSIGASALLSRRILRKYNL